MPEIFNAGKTNQPEVTPDIEKILETLPKSQWGSFVAAPSWAKFESQQDEEKVIIMGRRHLITNIGWVSLVVFAALIPMFWGEFPFVHTLNTSTLMELTVLWYTTVAFFGIQSFLSWFYNVFIVTNERVVDVDFVGLLSKAINVAQLSKIEDTNYSQNGFLANMFNFGDVIVETASKQETPMVLGDRTAFSFESIEFPDKVVAVISKLIEDEEHKNYHND